MNDIPATRKSRVAKKPAEPEPVTIRMDLPETDDLRRVGGSRSDRFNNALIRAVVDTGWFPPGQSAQDRDRQIFVSVTSLMAFKPADEIEGMLAAQLMAMHHASMECSRRAMVQDQPYEFAQGFRKAAANASRTFAELLAALDRKRGKGGQQVVRVEHVHVHPGGQAFVGNIAAGGHGGGGATEAAGEPHDPYQLANGSMPSTVIPALLRTDPPRDGVPSAGDAEPAVLPTRRGKHRPPNGRRY